MGKIRSASHIPPAGERLDSWKEIARYLKRDVRTVRRWEKQERLPVYRHVHTKSATVFAYRTELDAWWSERGNHPAAYSEDPQPHVKPEKGSNVDRAVLAILPFRNLGGTSAPEFFTDGLTEEMITLLGGLGAAGLTVIARTSSLSFKNSDRAPGEIGRALNADYVLTGSIRRSAKRVRIAAQLVRVAEQTYAWTESYDGDLGDILALQLEVAQAIAGQVEMTVISEKQESQKRTIHPYAYDCYLKARYFWNQRTEATLRKALELVEESIRKDSSFAPAYAAKADCYNVLGHLGVLAPREAFPQAKVAAREALSRDETLAEAHSSLAAATSGFDWNVADGEKGFQKAIDLNPSYATARQWLAELCCALGRWDEAHAQVAVAQGLDPLSSVIPATAGWLLHLQGKNRLAVEQCRRSLEFDGGFLLGHLYLGLACCEEGQADGLTRLRDAVRLAPNAPDVISTFGYASARWGQEAEAQRAIDNLISLSKKRYVSPYAIGVVFAGLGDKEAALDLLETAESERTDRLLWLNVDPKFDNLRSHPRFSNLVRRVGLPQNN